LLASPTGAPGISLPFAAGMKPNRPQENPLFLAAASGKYSARPSVHLF